MQSVQSGVKFQKMCVWPNWVTYWVSKSSLSASLSPSKKRKGGEKRLTGMLLRWNVPKYADHLAQCPVCHSHSTSECSAFPFPLAELWQLSKAASRVPDPCSLKMHPLLIAIWFGGRHTHLLASAAAGPGQGRGDAGSLVYPGTLPLPSMLWAVATLGPFTLSKAKKMLLMCYFIWKSWTWEEPKKGVLTKQSWCFPLRWLYFKRTKHSTEDSSTIFENLWNPDIPGRWQISHHVPQPPAFPFGRTLWA